MIMSLEILADAIQLIAATWPEWIGPAAKLALLLIAILNDDYLKRRSPHDIRRLVNSKPMKKLLAERGIEIAIDGDKRIVLRKKLI